MTQVTIFDDRSCLLGEGPLWHPERQQLFWFDILGKKLLTQENGGPKVWQFEEHVSAAGWVDQNRLLIASETRLFVFNLDTGTEQLICPLEADEARTRSNDGRADPKGGFWIGTMGKNAEEGLGSIYRYYRGELRQLVSNLSITNSICFSPDGKTAYFADTAKQTIQSVQLDPDGWPVGEPTVFVDLSSENLNPDGSVVDAGGNLWNAQWGAHRIACYSPKGAFQSAISFPAEQISCPAFGGPDLKTLHATSAAIGLHGDVEGQTFSVITTTAGQAEHRVILQDPS